MDGIKEAFDITRTAPSQESSIAIYATSLLRNLRHASAPTSFSAIHDRWSRGATQKSTERALQLLVDEGDIERIEDVGTRPKYRAYTEAERADRLAAANVAPAAPAPALPAAKRTRIIRKPAERERIRNLILQTIKDGGPMTTMQLVSATGESSGLISNMTALMQFERRIKRAGERTPWSIVEAAAAVAVPPAVVAPKGAAPADALDAELASVMQSLSTPRIVIEPIANLDAKVKVVQQLSTTINGAVGQILRDIGADLSRIASAVPTP